MIFLLTLFFSSPIGLGHITRDIAIIENIRKNFTYDQFELTTGDVAYDFILELNRFINGPSISVQNLYQPPKFSVYNGELKNSFLWVMKYLLYYYNCKKKLKNHFKKPSELSKVSEVIISDEDFASLSFSKQITKKRIFITDILNSQFSLFSSTFCPLSFFFKKIENILNKSLSNLINSSTCVIIPEIGDDKNNLYFTGPIVREIACKREDLRKKLQIHKKAILVSTGGTTAGLYLIKKALESFVTLKNKDEFELIISTPRGICISKNNNNIHIRNIGFVVNIHEFVYASDLVISLAGKSTIDECKVYGTPGIFIPIKNHFEQVHRANHMGYKFDDIFKLNILMEEKLSCYDLTNINRSNTTINNGVEKAASLIYKFLNNY